jgi:protein-tyrosine phosphatase
MTLRALRTLPVAACLAPLLALQALAGPGDDAPVEIGNFGVVDARVLRGAQPDDDDYEDLAAMGVTTVVDLRDDAEAYAPDEARRAGLEYVNIPLRSLGRPSDADVRRFFDALDRAGARGAGKVYVHCAGGRHRTGSMIGVYRVAHSGWSADRAYEEMKDYDYFTILTLFEGHKAYVFDYFERMRRDPSSVPVAYGAQRGRRT